MAKSLIFITLIAYFGHSILAETGVASPLKTLAKTTSESSKNVPKRSLDAFLGDAGINGLPAAGGGWSSGGFKLAGFSGGWNPWNSHSSRYISSPSPSEVANAIAAAKQASSNVLIAQQQMQAAKENVLNQQRMAMEKEAAAALLTQKSEAAAAIQRSEAAAAAQAVVLAQQRLAATKAAVAHQQRIAAAREAEAAEALKRSAHAAAAEIQKTEYEASKLGQLASNNNAGAAHHMTYAKDAAFGPINAGTNHVPNLESLGPWSGAGGAAAGGGKAAGPAGWL
ncbi:uncharacterized protein LOC101891474 [Musca domestica]|uniref:Uncharacterized protein LOC101891474 n=1 Tax=Musca domestica TaxID=7370 RepID=A0A9J7I977_MUSDO|nr:uncharacterized protein LOC101891474 [Musca domestica]